MMSLLDQLYEEEVSTIHQENLVKRYGIYRLLVVDVLCQKEILDFLGAQVQLGLNLVEVFDLPIDPGPRFAREEQGIRFFPAGRQIWG